MTVINKEMRCIYIFSFNVSSLSVAKVGEVNSLKNFFSLLNINSDFLNNPANFICQEALITYKKYRVCRIEVTEKPRKGKLFKSNTLVYKMEC